MQTFIAVPSVERGVVMHVLGVGAKWDAVCAVMRLKVRAEHLDDCCKSTSSEYAEGKPCCVINIAFLRHVHYHLILVKLTDMVHKLAM